MRTGSSPARLVAAAQGVFYLWTGLWPIVHIESFVAVTGDKEDIWLVQTVGALVLAIGLSLVVAAWLDRVDVPTRVLGAAAALAFLLVDLVFYWHGILAAVYLLDAVAEALLLAAWGFSSWAARRTTPKDAA